MTVEDVRGWLRERGAEAIPHPGGTLYAHLCRVHDRLGGLGLDADVRLAGLTHAAYGTDGFDVVLLDHTDREPLRRLVGDRAEALVHRYGACDRGRTWRRLADTGVLANRFTDGIEHLDAVALRPFVDLTIVNELDVIEQDPGIGRRHGDYFRAVFTTWRGLASPQVIDDAEAVLGPLRPAAATGTGGGTAHPGR